MGTLAVDVGLEDDVAAPEAVDVGEGTLGVPTTARMLAQGAHGLDAIEAGIRLIEADPSVRTVGRGGWPNLLGEMELDACMMDGSTLRSGAVGALQGFLHPVSVAREIIRRLPHEFLVGDGAARFVFTAAVVVPMPPFTPTNVYMRPSGRTCR